MTESDQPTRITGYRAVRDAARDVEAYSSDLLGERDIRSYRHLPLESDPPRHSLFRDALQPLFMGAAIEPFRDRFADAASARIDELAARGGGELVTELVLPYVIDCLCLFYNRPQDHAELLSWGLDVFSIDGRASTRTVDSYVERVMLETEEQDGGDEARLDMWDRIARLSIDGTPLSREEKHGIASLLLAGGRDTIVKLVTGLAWHLIRTPEDRLHLSENPGSYNVAISELSRFLSPLPEIERVATAGGARHPSAEPRYVRLSFVSANLDRTVWPDADRIDIHRPRVPNLAFGFGRHSCMGMALAQTEAKAFLDAFLADGRDWSFDGEPQIEWGTAPGSEAVEHLNRFVAVPVRTRPDRERPAF